MQVESVTSPFVDDDRTSLNSSTTEEARHNTWHLKSTSGPNYTRISTLSEVAVT